MEADLDLNRRRRIVAVALPFVALLGAWILAVELINPTRAVLASPADVVDRLKQLVSVGDIGGDILTSVRRLAIGIPLGCVSGILLGLAIARSQLLAMVISPWATLFMGISGLAWIPLAILWFGIGDGMVAFIIWSSTFFVVMLNTTEGVRAAPKDAEWAVRTLGGSRARVVRQVILPAALPSVVVGIRTAIALGWRSLVAAEFLGATEGLGHVVREGMTLFQSDTVLVGCLLLGIGSLITDRLVMAPIERRTLQRWGMITKAG